MDGGVGSHSAQERLVPAGPGFGVHRRLSNRELSEVETSPNHQSRRICACMEKEAMNYQQSIRTKCPAAYSATGDPSNRSISCHEKSHRQPKMDVTTDQSSLGLCMTRLEERCMRVGPT